MKSGASIDHQSRSEVELDEFAVHVEMVCSRLDTMTLCRLLSLSIHFGADENMGCHILFMVPSSEMKVVTTSPTSKAMAEGEPFPTAWEFETCSPTATATGPAEAATRMYQSSREMYSGMAPTSSIKRRLSSIAYHQLHLPSSWR